MGLRNSGPRALTAPRAPLGQQTASSERMKSLERRLKGLQQESSYITQAAQLNELLLNSVYARCTNLCSATKNLVLAQCHVVCSLRIFSGLMTIAVVGLSSHNGLFPCFAGELSPHLDCMLLWLAVEVRDPSVV